MQDASFPARTERGPARTRIRSQLALLTLAASLPLVALLVAWGSFSVLHSRDQARGTVRLVADEVSADLGDRIHRVRQALGRLAAREEVRTLDQARCQRLFEEYRASWPELANVTLAARDGRLLVSAVPLPPGGAPNAATMSWFQETMRAGEFRLSRPFVGRITGRWVVMLSLPVRDARGEVVAILGSPIDLASGLIRARRLAAGGQVAVYAADGTIITHDPEPWRWLGRSMQGSEVFRLAQRTATTALEAKDPDGVPRVFGFSDVSGTDWRVHVGIPRDVVFREGRILTRFVFPAAILLALLLSLLVTRAARGIERPISGLAAAARGVMEGRGESRAPVGGPAEVAEVATAFNLMVEVRTRSRRALERAVAHEREARSRAEVAEHHYLDILERMHDGFISLDPEWRFVFVNREAGALIGREPGSLLGKVCWDEFPEAIGTRFERAIRNAVDHQRPTWIEDHFEPWDRWFEVRVFPHRGGLDVYFHETSERRKAARAAAVNDMRLSLATEVASVGLWDWDLATDDVHYSDEWKRQLGYRPDEIQDRLEEWTRLTHPDDVGPALAGARASIAGPGHRYEAEFRMRHRDGAWRWILALANVVRDAAGRPERMLGCHIDITERRLAEEAAREQHRLLRDSQRIARIGSWSLDIASERITWTDEVYRLFGVEPAEFGHDPASLLEAIHPDDRAAMTRWIEDCAARREPGALEFRPRLRDGEHRVLRGQGRLELDAAQRPLRMFGTVQDVTERRRAERALRESEARLRLALEAAGMGTYDWDIPGERLVWSRRLEELWGFAPGEFTGTYADFASRVHPDDLAALERESAGARQARRAFALQYRVRRPDGSVHWVASHGRFAFDGSGEAVRLRGVVMDLTLAKQAEEEQARMRAALERSQALGAIGALVAGVAHEVRTPLFAITATLDAMDARTPAPEASKRYRGVLREQATRLERLMRNLLEYGRSPSAERVALRPAELLREAERDARGTTAPGAGVVWRLPDDLPELSGDPGGLQAVFRNLLENALLHSPEGGCVLVEARRAVRSGEAGLEILIRDAGDGIREDDLPHLFEPFFSRRPGGTGLGLSIVRRVVEDHGGEVRAANAPEGGALLTVWLPAAGAPADRVGAR